MRWNDSGIASTPPIPNVSTIIERINSLWSENEIPVIMKMPSNPDSATKPRTIPGTLHVCGPSRRKRNKIAAPAINPPMKFVSKPVLTSPIMLPARLVIVDWTPIATPVNRAPIAPTIIDIFNLSLLDILNEVKSSKQPRVLGAIQKENCQPALFYPRSDKKRGTFLM